MSFGDAVADESTTDRQHGRATLGKLAELFDRQGIPIEEVGRIQRYNLYQAMHKDPETGEAVVTDLASIQVMPGWADGPAWPVVDQAPPIRLTPTRAKRRKRRGGWRTALVAPDPQIGYRRDIETGELDPFHDERAMRCFTAAVRHYQPDLIVCKGDYLDLPEMSSKFRKEPGFAQTTQAAINRGTEWLAEIANAAPDARRVLMEGNHDRRLQDYITDNAIAAFGLKRGDDPPDSWPVLSVPYLLNMERYGWEYVPGYPAGIFWINDNLCVIHGKLVRSGGSTAAAVVDDERVSTLFGHIHRIEVQHKTRRVKGDGDMATKAKTSVAASFGCLCRTDGAVPSTKSATDPLGRPLLGSENWQQGFGVVQYEPGNGRFRLDAVPIHEGWAMLADGTELVA